VRAVSEMNTQVWQIAQYDLRMMCAGPRYDARTRTLRIPHRARLSSKKIADEWTKRKFVFDARTREYTRVIPERFAGKQVQLARNFYFRVYQAFNPAIKSIEIGEQ
jgi:hypothetical protein